MSDHWTVAEVYARAFLRRLNDLIFCYPVFLQVVYTTNQSVAAAF